MMRDPYHYQIDGAPPVGVADAEPVTLADLLKGAVIGG